MKQRCDVVFYSVIYNTVILMLTNYILLFYLISERSFPRLIKIQDVRLMLLLKPSALINLLICVVVGQLKEMCHENCSYYFYFHIKIY